jgi:hypothetical protein
MRESIQCLLSLRGRLSHTELCRALAEVTASPVFRDLEQRLGLQWVRDLPADQAPAFWKQRKVWFQIARNFRELEGSWVLGLRKLASLFEGASGAGKASSRVAADLDSGGKEGPRPDG